MIYQFDQHANPWKHLGGIDGPVEYTCQHATPGTGMWSPGPAVSHHVPTAVVLFGLCHDDDIVKHELLVNVQYNY